MLNSNVKIPTRNYGVMGHPQPTAFDVAIFELAGYRKKFGRKTPRSPEPRGEHGAPATLTAVIYCVIMSVTLTRRPSLVEYPQGSHSESQVPRCSTCHFSHARIYPLRSPRLQKTAKLCRRRAV